MAAHESFLLFSESRNAAFLAFTLSNGALSALYVSVDGYKFDLQHDVNTVQNGIAEDQEVFLVKY